MALENGSSLSVLDHQSLCLVSVVDSNPLARLSRARGSLTLSPSQASNPGVLELPRVRVRDEGEFSSEKEVLQEEGSQANEGWGEWKMQTSSRLNPSGL